MRRYLAIATLSALTGCAAPQQQTAIPPSPTGCYYRVPGVGIGGPLIPLIQPRYEPAPCNVINGNQPIVNEQAPAIQQPELPPPQSGGTWGIAGPGGVATGSGGTWSGAGPGWAGSGAGGM